MSARIVAAARSTRVTRHAQDPVRVEARLGRAPAAGGAAGGSSPTGRARRRRRPPGGRPPRAARASVPRARPARSASRPRAAPWRARDSSHTRRRSPRAPPTSAAAPSSCAATAALAALEQHRHPAGAEDVERARHELRAEQRRDGRAASASSRLDDERARGRGQRVEPEARRARSSASRPARAADELAEVVAGDVLHDLAAGVRDRAVGEHERDAEHEVARRAEAVARAGRRGSPARQAPIVGSPGGSSESRWPCSAERVVQRGEPDPRLDGAREVARLVLEDAVEPPVEDEVAADRARRDGRSARGRRASAVRLLDVGDG